MNPSMATSVALLSLLLSLLLRASHSTTILVDGVSQWRNPVVYVGDSVIFRHKEHYYSLYIFQNQRAFSLGNFTHATLLAEPDSTYTWHPSRPGFFYFAFNNSSAKVATSRLGFEKLAIEVAPSPSPERSAASPAEPPSVSPEFQWPFIPTTKASPAPAPGVIAVVMPGKGGIPFINSNPAVPLPTGEVDSATITPLSISTAMAPPRNKVKMEQFAVSMMSLLFLWMGVRMV